MDMYMYIHGYVYIYICISYVYKRTVDKGDGHFNNDCIYDIYVCGYGDVHLVSGLMFRLGREATPEQFPLAGQAGAARACRAGKGGQRADSMSQCSF